MKFKAIFSEHTDDIKVTRAPEPTDVYWENLKVSRRERLLTMLITYTASFALIFIWV